MREAENGDQEEKYKNNNIPTRQKEKHNSVEDQNFLLRKTISKQVVVTSKIKKNC